MMSSFGIAESISCIELGSSCPIVTNYDSINLHKKTSVGVCFLKYPNLDDIHVFCCPPRVTCKQLQSLSTKKCSKRNGILIG